MKLTEALKKWLVAEGLSAADASDDDYRKAAAEAIANGKLTSDKLVELTKEPEAGQASQLQDTLSTIMEQQRQIADRLAAVEANAPTSSSESSSETESKSTPEVELKDTAPRSPDGQKDADSESVFEKMFGQGTGVEVTPDRPLIRQIGAEERYSKSKETARFPDLTERGMKHPFAGQPVFEGGNKGRRQIEHPSELDQAVAGAYIKLAIESECGGTRGVPQNLRMNDHDRGLIQYALANMKWAGVIHGEGSEDEGAIALKGDKLTAPMQKAILDDAVSGGLEIAPIVFDDQIILIPLLNGEFFPRVNVVNITRGRRIEGGSMGNVTLTSGGADGTPIPLFNTANFISAFDTLIHVVNGAIEIGLDFLSDTPIDVANIITQQYGQVLLTWLDEQVNVGDGVTEPEGVVNAGGTTTVSSANGVGGPPTVGDYEGLLFSIPKNYKQGFPTNRITYGANELTYQRARGIAVGGADQRRVFGMNQEDYMLFGHPYGIGEFYTNSQITFVNWGRYRMYRRMGLTLKVTDSGKELVRNNLIMLTARARYGGQIEDGAAVGLMTDAQS